MKLVTRTFLRGLAVLLPIVTTAYVLWWAGTTAETAMEAVWRKLLPPDLYRPGFGVLAGLVLVFLCGVLMNLWIARKLVRLAEGLVERLPLVKTLYGSVKDLMGFFSGSKERAMNEVVRVEVAGGSVLGLRTRDAVPELGLDDRVAVYVPMSYQVGGFTVLVPKDVVHPVDMSVEDGMRFAMTAGVTSGGEDD